MPKKPPHPLSRRYRQTPYDKRPKCMKVYDFTRPMTQSERASLFSSLKTAINRVFEMHAEKHAAEQQTLPNPPTDQTWWQFLQSNRQQYKRIL
jgi:hypothetical protein